MRSRCQHGKGQFWGGNRKPIVNFTDTPRSAVQIRLNRSRCRLGCGLSWAESITCYMGGPAPPWEGAIWWIRAPIVKYRHFRRLCKNGWTYPFDVSAVDSMHKFNRQCAPTEGHVAVTRRITLNHPSTAAMRLWQITLTTCYLWTRPLTQSRR